MFTKALFWPSVITIPALIILVALGVWQLDRLEQKTALLSQIDTRFDLAAKPLPAPAKWGEMTKESWNFTPVSLEGSFDHGREFHVFAHTSDDKGRFKGAGYLVMTPFKLAYSEKYILINRGFVPEENKQSETRSEGLITQDIRVEGVLRFSEEPNKFTPEPDIKKNIWFVRNSNQMAALMPEREFAPFFIELRSSSVPVALPKAYAKKPVLNNNHLSYALTWFGMACGLLVIFIVYARRNMKQSTKS